MRATRSSRSRCSGRSGRSTSASRPRCSCTRRGGGALPDPTLYLFDGYNVLRAAGLEERQELVDALASFVAVRGARGVVVFDGVGADQQFGALEVRFASHADALLERLAAEFRERERVCLVSSDAAVRGTTGQTVAKISSREFASTLEAVEHREDRPSRVGDRLDPETRERLERLRRAES